jgi:uncharacterized protein YndB with AHSA1/START domain
MPVKTVEVYEYVVEMTMAALPEKVWNALTSEIGQWWPKEYYSTPAAKAFAMECELGGKVYEDWGNGHGATWGTVVVWHPYERLILALELFPGFGGPGRSYLTYELKANETSTIVRMSDSGLCANAKKQGESLQTGWTDLLTRCKTYVEKSSSYASLS